MAERRLRQQPVALRHPRWEDNMATSDNGSSGKLPGPYVHDVKKDENLMHYIPTETMGIGARRSGLPDSASAGPKSLQHVGESDGTAGRGKHKRGSF